MKRAGLPEHVTQHVVTMGELHRAGRYDRQADGVERVTGRPAMGVREFVALHADESRRASAVKVRHAARDRRTLESAFPC